MAAQIITSDNFMYTITPDQPVAGCATQLVIPSRITVPYTKQEIEDAFMFCYGTDRTNTMNLNQLITAISVAETFGLTGYYQRAISVLASRFDGKSAKEILLQYPGL